MEDRREKDGNGNYIKKVELEDESSSEEEKRPWKRSNREVQEVKEANMMELSEEEEDSRPPRGRKASCPLSNCDYQTRGLRTHVNHMHLPKIMWDYHSPPVKPERFQKMNKIRGEVLLFLAKTLVKSSSITDLLIWCTEQPGLIPRKAGILGRHIEQMRSLSETLLWRRPPYNRYTLNPPNHTSVLIHWRYQVAMLQQLPEEAVEIYLNMGKDFMNDADNFVSPAGRKRKRDSNQLRSVVVRKQPEWDEGEELEDRRKVVVTVDVCGDPDEIEDKEIEDVDEEGTVTIGETRYILVLKGSTLDIRGGLHRRTPEQEQGKGRTEEELQTSRWEAMDVFDSHLHLDRTSKRLLGNLQLSMEDWIQNQMERPPRVPVNIIGALLIFCDPECFPKTIPIQDQWRVAVGVHPKKVGRLTEEQQNQFLKLIGSERVSAVGEIGMDRTAPENEWQEQLDFLVNTAPFLQAVNKPIILHVRSAPEDHYSQLLYIILLKTCSKYFGPHQKFVLHCFTGTPKIVQLWNHHFENTYFGFTQLTTKFDETQKEALCQIPANRLLLETDAPYMPPPGITSNSPIYIGETARAVARVRGETVERICRSATVNAASLFGLH